MAEHPSAEGGVKQPFLFKNKAQYGIVLRQGTEEFWRGLPRSQLYPRSGVCGQREIKVGVDTLASKYLVTPPKTISVIRGWL